MKLEQILPLIEYKISEGTDYLWPCFGEQCWQLSFLDVEGRELGQLVHNRSGEVLFIAFTYVDNSKYTAYHWVEPECKEAYLKECAKREVDINRYDSDNLSIELELQEDVFQKLAAIYKMEIFDKRILVSMELPEKTLESLNLMAQENNRTLDDEVNHLLSEYIKKQKM